MATTTQPVNSATPAPLASVPNTNGTSAGYAHPDASTNGHTHHHHHVTPQDPRPAPIPTPAMAANKKGKGKKAPFDANEFSKQVMGRITQLEVDSAAEKEQEAEIDREVRKAKRELNNQTYKLNDLEKIDLLTRKWSELFASMKRLERDNVKNKKRADQLQKDKDTSRTEASKQTSLKEKLEKLCRELQKENNKLKNEQRTLRDAHDKLKKDSDNRFDTVFKTLEGYQEDKDNPRKQVMNTKVEDLFKNRFKSLIDQYELRELHFHSLMRTKEIEVQYNMARFEQQKKLAEAEINRARQLHGQVQTFSKTESELRTQLNLYVDKFKQVSGAMAPSQVPSGSRVDRTKVEDTLNNSNDLFLTFRKEMEDMSKKTKKLEKENEAWKRKHDLMNQNTLKMVDERGKYLKELEEIRKKSDKLTSIINQMQQQGRGIPPGMQGSIEGDYAEEGEGPDDVEEESEYEYEDEEGDDEGSEEGEFDDDTEEEHYEPSAAETATIQPAYGPDRPPVPAQAITQTAAPTMNGHL